MAEQPTEHAWRVVYDDEGEWMFVCPSCGTIGRHYETKSIAAAAAREHSSTEAKS